MFGLDVTYNTPRRLLFAPSPYRKLLPAKPSKKIFRLAFEAINASPEEVLHIGDNLNTDVCGAKNVGAQTVWITNGVKTKFFCKPDYVVDSVLEVKDIINKNYT